MVRVAFVPVFQRSGIELGSGSRWLMNKGPRKLHADYFPAVAHAFARPDMMKIEMSISLISQLDEGSMGISAPRHCGGRMWLILR